MEEIFFERGFRPKPVMTASDEPAVLSMIKTGVGLNLMFEDQARTLAKENSLVVWEQERFAFPLSFATLESAQDDERVQVIKKVIEGIW